MLAIGRSCDAVEKLTMPLAEALLGVIQRARERALLSSLQPASSAFTQNSRRRALLERDPLPQRTD